MTKRSPLKAATPTNQTLLPLCLKVRTSRLPLDEAQHLEVVTVLSRLLREAAGDGPLEEKTNDHP